MRNPASAQCPRCEMANYFDSRFCANCGASLMGDPEPARGAASDGPLLHVFVPAVDAFASHDGEGYCTIHNVWEPAPA